MIIKEDKKRVKNALFLNITLSIIGICVFMYNYEKLAIFVILVGIVGVFFCAKKMFFSNNFLRVDKDGFLIKNGKKEHKFHFNDLEKIGIKTIQQKKNIQVLNFIFKKNFKIENRFSFLRFYNDKEATLPDIYEESFYKIEKILKDKFNDYLKNV